MNGRASYDVTENLEAWTNEDLLGWVFDGELMMGLEKYQVVRMAQEVAARYEPYAEDESTEYND